MMSKEPKDGDWVELHIPVCGYIKAQLVEYQRPQWLLITPSGCEFLLYDHEFDLEN